MGGGIHTHTFIVFKCHCEPFALHHMHACRRQGVEGKRWVSHVRD
jgi:hypothetical protein